MRTLSALVLLAALSCVSPARADDDTSEKAQARLLLAQGNSLFEKGDLKGALVVFRAAYALYPSPKLLVNAAAAERELGDLPGAANDLRRFLDELPDPPDDPFLADKARTDLRALERRLGRIALSGWPPRTTVEVDGKPARDPFYVRAGEHHVRAHAPLGADEERDVSVGTGETVELPYSARGVSSPASERPRTTGKKSLWWVGVVVGGVVLIGAGVGLAVGFTVNNARTPVSGDLGTINFSDFK
jgi:hypothetical protein